MSKYYLRQVPQSEYRSLRVRDKSVEQKYKLDLDLKDLKIKNDELKKLLVEKIKEEGWKVLRVILPEELWEGVIDGPCFEEIYRRLGLI
jgi:hypothetical protein